jgi:calcium-dependent protein kinase
MLLAINHCHSNNIVHRDLKPENIMLKSTIDPQTGQETISDIKIIDFGLGRVYQEAKTSLSAVVGTCYYVAPEVIDGSYGFECDFWSLGVILYIMLSGHLPFPGRDNQEVFDRIKFYPIRFHHKEFDGVSD